MRKMPVLLISVLVAHQAFAQSKNSKPFQYFEGKDVDYWNEGKKVKETILDELNYTNNDEKINKVEHEKKESFSGSTAIRSSDLTPFSWKKYNDPKSVEFWDDGGNWIPPRPFREAASNPTKENIDAYLNWMVRKTAVVEKFQYALKNYTGQNQDKGSNHVQQNVFIKKEENKAALNNVSDFNWGTLQVAYFYQTACAHCKKSIPLTQKIQSLGAQVNFIQLDSNTNPPAHENSIPYNEDLDNQFHVSSTPTWFLKVGNNYTRITGETSLSVLLTAAKNLSNKENK